MDRRIHHHADNDLDEWARLHGERGDQREPELSKATQGLLEAARVEPGCRVLDVACGAGYTAAAASAAGAEAVGIDASAAMIRIAKERFPDTRFIEADMLAPPEGPWDAIVCRLGAHHADISWLSAAWTVLKPGGRLAIAERDAADEGDRARGMKSPAEWKGLFKRAGFERVRIVPSGASLGGLIYIIFGEKR